MNPRFVNSVLRSFISSFAAFCISSILQSLDFECINNPLMNAITKKEITIKDFLFLKLSGIKYDIKLIIEDTIDNNKI